MYQSARRTDDVTWSLGLPGTVTVLNHHGGLIVPCGPSLGSSHFQLSWYHLLTSVRAIIVEKDITFCVNRWRQMPESSGSSSPQSRLHNIDYILHFGMERHSEQALTTLIYTMVSIGGLIHSFSSWLVHKASKGRVETSLYNRKEL